MGNDVAPASTIRSDPDASPNAARNRSGASKAMLWAGLLTLALGAWLYGPLFFPPSIQGLESQGDQFFFEVNEAAGAPVLILALWLFYRRSHLRDELFGPGQPVAGLAAWLATLGLYGWAVFTGAADLQLASVIGFLFGGLLMWGGMGAVRAYWLPVVFLGFALPISPFLISAVIWPVQLATAKYAGFLLNAIGMQSYVQGDQILRPGNTFIVIETCSGLRSVVTLTMLTILLIDLFERRGWHAAILILLAPIVALLTNGIRVVTLVMNPHSDIASVHSLQGIVMLLVGLTLLYGIDLLLGRVLGTDDPGALENDYGRTRRGSELSRSRVAALSSPAIVLLLMFVLRAGVTPYDATKPLLLPVDSLVFEALGDLRSREISPNYKYRGTIHYRSWSRRRIDVDGRPVDLLVGLANPTNRKLTMYSGRFAQPDSGFETVEETAEPLAPGSPDARRVIFQRGLNKTLSFSWYEPPVDFVEEFLRHGLALDRSPLARTETAVAIRLSTPWMRGESEADARARLVEVYQRIEPVAGTLRKGAPGGL